MLKVRCNVISYTWEWAYMTFKKVRLPCTAEKVFCSRPHGAPLFTAANGRGASAQGLYKYLDLASSTNAYLILNISSITGKGEIRRGVFLGSSNK